MKAYGLPRDNDIEFPDLGDCRTYALKTSAGGDRFKNKSEKRRVRRIFKKAERHYAKDAIRKENNDE